MDGFAAQSLTQVQSAQKQAVLDKLKGNLDISRKAEKLDADTLSKIDQAAKDYEAVFLAEMLDHMFKDVPIGGGYGSDEGGAQSIYKQHLVREYAGQLAQNGGIGLAEPLRNQLIEIQASTIKETNKE